MASLTAELAQRNVQLPTRKALLLCDLQNDFLLPDGKMPVVSTTLIDRIRRLAPAFREHGYVIWVRSQFHSDRRITTDASHEGGVGGSSPDSGDSLIHPPDREQYLSLACGRSPCCLPNSRGFFYSDRIADLIDHDNDLQLIKTHYSAFNETSLLTALRSKLITSLYIGGCITNMSVAATAVEAARYGIKITIVDDCLGYHNEDRHGMALHHLREYIEARVMASVVVIQELRTPPPPPDRRGTHGERIEQLISGRRPELDGGQDNVQSMLLTLRAPEMSQRLMAMHFEYDEQQKQSLRPETVFRETSRAKISVRDSETAEQRSSRRGQSTAGRQVIAREGQSSDGAISAQDGVDKLKGHSTGGDAELQFDTVDWRARSSIVEQHRAPATVETPANVVDKAATSDGRRDQGQPLFGVGREADSAGSTITFDLLPPELAGSIFQRLDEEVPWQKMMHQTGEVPRLVDCQASVGDDGSAPVYRHPSDQTLPVRPWTPAVDEVRRAAEQLVGHELNHCLIQLYRGGTDYISEHSDKTLDIARGSSIVNVSFGAQRSMRFRTKRGDECTPGRRTFRVPLPHNSLLALSLRSNATYLHGINPDKRPRVELGPAETAFGGRRISLTFRRIATFLTADAGRIWGQGATAKTRDRARPVVSGDEVESEKLVQAFGRENRASVVAWEATYGGGSNVLHLRMP